MSCFIFFSFSALFFSSSRCFPLERLDALAVPSVQGGGEVLIRLRHCIILWFRGEGKGREGKGFVAWLTLNKIAVL